MSMRRRIRAPSVTWGFLFTALVAGCGDDTTAPAPILVSVNPTSASVHSGDRWDFISMVANDASNAGVTWTLAGPGCSGATCGSLSATSSASGASIRYVAPATIPTPATVTITAVSVADDSKFASATITILPPNIVVNIGDTASVEVNAQHPFTATVTNDPWNAGVTWTVTGAGCSGAACGTIAPTRSASGSPVTYTAPATWPDPPDVTITATSVTDNSRSASVIVPITSLIEVSVTPLEATLDVHGQRQLTATVANDPLNAGVTWTVAGGGCSDAACGTVSTTRSASGVAIIYTAPAIVSNLPVSVTAVSVADGRKSAAATITLTSSVSVSVSPAIAGVDAGTTRSFTATVSSDPSNLGVTWTLNCSDLDCGALSASSSASGVPVSYTAPAIAGSPSPVIVTATSVTDYNKSTSATVVVTTPGVVAVRLNPTSTGLTLSGAQEFTAMVFNDPNGSGVAWTATGGGCSGATCGTFSAERSASGASVIYTAPDIVPNPGTVTVTATSVTDNGQSAPAQVSITSLIQVSLAPTGVIGVDVNTTGQFAAAISNDPGTRGVIWTLTGAGCSGAACGSISPSGSYTAPATAPAPATVTVRATSVTDYTRSATATIVITTPGVITVAVVPTSAVVCVNPRCRGSRSKQFTAFVFNDQSNAGVTWTTGRGTISPTRSASGVAVTYTSTGTTRGSTQVTATSVADTTKSGDATVTLN